MEVGIRLGSEARGQVSSLVRVARLVDADGPESKGGLDQRGHRSAHISVG